MDDKAKLGLNLRPCPVCGSKPEVHERATRYPRAVWYSIGCSNRDCLDSPDTDWNLHLDRAVAEWNGEEPEGEWFPEVFDECDE